MSDSRSTAACWLMAEWNSKWVSTPANRSITHRSKNKAWPHARHAHTPLRSTL